jgi:hypothetical protein
MLQTMTTKNHPIKIAEHLIPKFIRIGQAEGSTENEWFCQKPKASRTRRFGSLCERKAAFVPANYMGRVGTYQMLMLPRSNYYKVQRLSSW